MHLLKLDVGHIASDLVPMRGTLPTGAIVWPALASQNDLDRSDSTINWAGWSLRQSRDPTWVMWATLRACFLLLAIAAALFFPLDALFKGGVYHSDDFVFGLGFGVALAGVAALCHFIIRPSSCFRIACEFGECKLLVSRRPSGRPFDMTRRVQRIFVQPVEAVFPTEGEFFGVFLRARAFPFAAEVLFAVFSKRADAVESTEELARMLGIGGAEAVSAVRPARRVVFAQDQ